MKETKVRYFCPPGFMCEKCVNVHDNISFSQKIRLDSLLNELGSFKKVFHQQKKWSEAMLCIYCGSEVDVGD